MKRLMGVGGIFMIKRLLLVAVLLASACGRQWVPIPAPQVRWVAAPLDQAGEAADSDARVRKGDIVRVQTRDGQENVFDVYQVDGTVFHGVSLVDHRKYRVEFAALKQMEVRRWGVGVVQVPYE